MTRQDDLITRLNKYADDKGYFISVKYLGLTSPEITATIPNLGLKGGIYSLGTTYEQAVERIDKYFGKKGEEKADETN